MGLNPFRFQESSFGFSRRVLEMRLKPQLLSLLKVEPEILEGSLLSNAAGEPKLADVWQTVRELRQAGGPQVSMETERFLTLFYDQFSAGPSQWRADGLPVDAVKWTQSPGKLSNHTLKRSIALLAAEINVEWFLRVARSEEKIDLGPTALQLLKTFPNQPVPWPLLWKALSVAGPEDFPLLRKSLAQHAYAQEGWNGPEHTETFWHRLAEFIEKQGFECRAELRELWRKYEQVLDKPSEFALVCAKAGEIHALDAYVKKTTGSDIPSFSLQPLFPEAPALWLEFPAWYLKNRPNLAWDEAAGKYRLKPLPTN